MKPLRALFALFVVVVFLIIIFAGDPDLDRNRIKRFQRDEKTVDKETFESKLKELEPQRDQNDQTSPPKTRIFLFIMILTSPKGTERRDAIRNTWLKLDDSGQYMAKFIIGGKSLTKSERDMVEAENKNYKDLIIISDLKDGYHELTNKVLQGFRWIDQHIDCSYVLKADDDSFVRVDAVLSELEGQTDHEETKDQLYWGFFRGNANVKRRGQWAEKKWVLCDHYLPYANGGGYVLSSKLIHFISKNWDYFQLYNSEDVSVGKKSRAHWIFGGKGGAGWLGNWAQFPLLTYPVHYLVEHVMHPSNINHRSIGFFINYMIIYEYLVLLRNMAGTNQSTSPS